MTIGLLIGFTLFFSAFDVTHVKVCEDRYEGCANGYVANFCSHPDYTVEYKKEICAKSCNLCDVNDEDSSTESAKTKDSLFEFPSTTFEPSTGRCQDSYESCANGWVENFCDHPGYTLEQKKEICGVSCNLCDSPYNSTHPTNITSSNSTDSSVSCEDNHLWCAELVPTGFCKLDEFSQNEKIQYCAKSCNLCSAIGEENTSVVTESTDTCGDKNADWCSFLAAFAFCNYDRFTLAEKKKFCGKSCNLCDADGEENSSVAPESTDTFSDYTSTSPVDEFTPCVDNSNDCPGLVEDGFCTDTRFTLAEKKKFCGKSCNLCDSVEASSQSPPNSTQPDSSVSCEDNYKECTTWVEEGFCTRESVELLDKVKYCPKSCHLCDLAKITLSSTSQPSQFCTDGSRRCPALVEQGFCTDETVSFAYKKDLCNKSCNLCDVDGEETSSESTESTDSSSEYPSSTTVEESSLPDLPPCEDKSKDCAGMVAIGFCTDKLFSFDEKMEYCAKSCNLCGPQ